MAAVSWARIGLGCRKFQRSWIWLRGKIHPGYLRQQYSKLVSSRSTTNSDGFNEFLRLDNYNRKDSLLDLGAAVPVYQRNDTGGHNAVFHPPGFSREQMAI